MTTLFNIEQYQNSYQRDWDGANYDPAWDKPDDVSEKSHEKVSSVVEVSTGEEEIQPEVSERWNPKHFGETPRKVDETGNPTVFWDESIEPPLPDDFESLQEYEEAWLRWEIENCDRSICAAGLGRDFPSPDCSLENLNSSDSAKSTSGVETDCSNASPMSPSTTTLNNSPESRESTASPHRHHVNPLPLKENDSVEQTIETASPQYCNLSAQSNLNTSVWKTSPDCYRHPDDLETKKEHIFNRCSKSFMKAGTMHNGLLSERGFTSEPDGLVKDSCSLPRPGALSWSGKGRPPGNTKSEAKAKKIGLIAKNEVYNPEWLEQEFGLPIGWTDPQEHRAATQLLELEGQPSEIFLTPESPRSPSAESCTSTHSSNKGKKKSSDCWYTPPHIIELIIQVLGVIDLDPCADDGKHIPARSHFTFNSDGLAAVWEGRVFMNPPYSCPGLWMKKLCAEFESGRVREAIALVPAATDTKWLSPFLKTQVVCFWTGRIKFLDEDYQPKLAARQSHVLVYWGENWERFKEVFEPHGFVSVPSQFLEDRLVEQVSPFKEKDDCKFIEDKQVKNQSSRNTEKFGELIHEKLNNQSVSEEKHEFLDDTNYSSRKTRRSRGEGSGCIYYRTITKNGKEYCEAYYQYELWSDGNAVIKTTKYIPKRLLQQIQDLNSQKTPVWKILQVLSVLL